ncbi:MAG: YbaK/EbsC family protein [Candidatus Latescibacter sp.]|nr:YbaK/EbsC family protein [Candidatus Latescibacter sp.]
MKTNALRIIEKLGIPYEIREYAVDENDLSATHVASDIGLPSGQVFKTLVAGYVRGGVSPVGTKKRFPVFLDKSALDWPFISLSAGARGCQMLLNPADLGKVVDVQIQKISKLSEPLFFGIKG